MKHSLECFSRNTTFGNTIPKLQDLNIQMKLHKLDRVGLRATVPAGALRQYFILRPVLQLFTIVSPRIPFTVQMNMV